MFDKDKWSVNYNLESLTKNYEFISKDNLLHLFYNGQNEEEFKKILDEKNTIDKEGGNFNNLNEDTFFNILDCLINQNISNIKSNKEIKFIQSNSNKSFKVSISQINNKKVETLVDLLFNKDIFNSKIKSIIEKLSTDEFELFLF